MSFMMEKLEERISLVEKEIYQLNFDDNNTRRRLYSQAQLILLDIEEKYEENDENVINFIKRIETCCKSIPLKPLNRKRYLLDDLCRFIFINSGLFFLGVYASLPLMLIKTIERSLKIPTSKSLALEIRKWFAWLMLTAAGVVTETFGLDSNILHQLESSDSVSILTFAHNSNFDGFLVSLTCPLGHYALAKKELFCIPFFSWLSLAIGGVPVDRQNRDRAIHALQRSTQNAKTSKVCLVIAPEGTRSVTGQLQGFKKGTFYMWEQLQSPIIPFINYGGYDLFPVGNWLNVPGKVIIRYLTTIQPNEAKSRDEMLRLLRKRMLIALMESPTGTGDPLTWPQYINTYIVSTAVLLFNILTVRAGYLYVHRTYELSYLTISGIFIGVSVLITMGLYLYNVYIIDLFTPKFPSKDKKN